jgi:hypothetical protein
MTDAPREVEIVGGAHLAPPTDDDLLRRCPCGWRENRASSRQRHANAHLAWAMGAPIPASLPWPAGSVAVVHTTSPIAQRRVAYQLARSAQRAGGYDFASFPAPIGRGYLDEEHTRALLYRVGEAAVGYVALADMPTFNRWDFVPRELPPGADRQIRPAVMLAWTAFHWRRRGIAGALVRAAAEHAGVATDGLSWATPFTDDGRALARSFAGPDGGVWLA